MERRFIFRIHGYCIMLVMIQTVSCQTPPYEISCDGAPDGLREIGCWGYANCFNGRTEVHACPGGTFLNRETMTCTRPGDGRTDCYLPTDCLGRPDGSYADYGSRCISYYRCQAGVNLGRHYCPAPTAFNEEFGVCDYVINLRPPCGNAGISNLPEIGIFSKSPQPLPTPVPVAVAADVLPPRPILG